MKYHQKQNSSKGFTLIEMLVVVAIIGTVASLVALPFMTFRQQTLLNVGTEDVATLINKARLSTLGSKGDKRYGIHFEATKVVMFEGATYSSGASTNETRTLDPSLSITGIVINGGGSNIVFDRVLGGTTNFGTSTLYVIARPAASTTIVINRSGVVTLE